MTQSHKHDMPKLAGESHDAYERRTWRAKLNCRCAGELALDGAQEDARLIRVDGSPMDAEITIPAHGIHQCICAAAKYSNNKIKGQGQKTWTKKFMSGIMVTDSPGLGICPNSVRSISILANSDGVRGSGKRVPRKLPLIEPGWSATVEIFIIDPIITRDIFLEMLALAGIAIGVGQFRPQNGGTNGRFRVESLEWEDNREFVA